MPRSAVGPLIASVVLLAVAAVVLALSGDSGEPRQAIVPPTEATVTLAASTATLPLSPPATLPPSTFTGELAVNRGLEPPTVDAQELFVVDAQGGEPVLIHSTTGPMWLIAWAGHCLIEWKAIAAVYCVKNEEAHYAAKKHNRRQVEEYVENCRRGKDRKVEDFAGVGGAHIFRCPEPSGEGGRNPREEHKQRSQEDHEL